jgi:hypothetical protein
MAMLTPFLVKERRSRLFTVVRVGVNHQSGWLRQATRKNYDRRHEAHGCNDSCEYPGVSQQKIKCLSVNDLSSVKGHSQVRRQADASNLTKTRHHSSKKRSGQRSAVSAFLVSAECRARVHARRCPRWQSPYAFVEIHRRMCLPLGRPSGLRR